jgi:hypothetical protein
MRIVIEVDGQRITAVGPDAAPAALDAVAMVGDAPPGPAPKALLDRAKKLGAISAGAAQFGRGAALAPATLTVEQPRASRARASRKAASKNAKKRARR